MGKYEEALERAKAGRPLDEVFPELKESEDERIKNLIYCIVRDRSDVGKLLEANGCPVQKALSWLEKQKDNTEKEYVFRPLAGTDITTAAKHAIERAKDGDHLVLAFNGMYTPDSKYDSTKGLVDKYNTYLKEQNPAEWSEEDKNFIKELCDLFASIAKNNYVGRYYAPDLVSKLQSLRPQPHWKPSEEQMEALLLVSGVVAPKHRETLKSLYSDLKKLI